MNFLEAYKAAKKGKKVKRKDWISSHSFEDFHESKSIMTLCTIEDFEAEDWEVAEETLPGKAAIPDTVWRLLYRADSGTIFEDSQVFESAEKAREYLEECKTYLDGSYESYRIYEQGIF